MDKQKKILNVIAILLVLLVFLLIIFFVNKNRLESQDGSDVVDEPYYSSDPSVQNNGIVDKISTRSEFFLVKRVIEKYYLLSLDLFNNPEDANIRKNFFNLFSSEYIKEYELTENNISEKISNSECNSVRIDDIYVVRSDEAPNMYFVKGLAINIEKQISEEYTVIVMIDVNNSKAAILLEDYVNAHQYNNITIGQEISIISNQLINDNGYYYENVSENEYVTYMFEEFKNDCIYFPERAYNNLSLETKNNRFPNLDTFKNYISSNMRSIILLKLASYIKLEDGYKCMNEEGEYYMFKTEGIMDYSVNF